MYAHCKLMSVYVSVPNCTQMHFACALSSAWLAGSRPCCQAPPNQAPQDEEAGNKLAG